MRVAFLLFDGITALDVVGPYEVLARLPGAEVIFAAPEAGAVTTGDGHLGLLARASIDEVARADVLLVPGGHGTRQLVDDARVLDWVRAIDASSAYTTSVCTGSLVLGAAGLLEGKRATTHWSLMERLRTYGAIPTDARVVDEGRLVTAAGVSSGIDMALALAATIAGAEVAQAIQLGIEYDPQPPFASGSVAKAPPAVLALARARLR